MSGSTCHGDIVFGRAICGDWEASRRREWLVTNGIGGFACGTLSGVLTRRYHGLLVAALQPPLGRTLLVAKLDPVAHFAGRRYPLMTNAFVDGTVDPQGYLHLESFRLEGLIPVWRFALADARLEQRLWMAQGQNRSYVRFTLVRASEGLRLDIAPLCGYRDFHALGAARWEAQLRAEARGFSLTAFPGARPYRVASDRGAFTAGGAWYRDFAHAIEAERGFDAVEDLYVPGHFALMLAPGESATIVCEAEESARVPPWRPVPGPSETGLASESRAERALAEEHERQAALLARLPDLLPDWQRRLALAADQFIAGRALGGSGGAEAAPGHTEAVPGHTVIAGYPWFGDWGRDTMIALPGLTLATGRPELAAGILRAYAGFVDRGMLPNRFPDSGGAPETNTVDATLWYFEAARQTVQHGAEPGLAADLFPVLADIVEWHRRGTRFGIGVDAEDGLLRAGEPGLQLTWMDARAGGREVTPRIGKPVEVNALWHNALRVMAELAARLGDPGAAGAYRREADAVAAAFRARFWYAAGGYLYDVVDGPEGEPDPLGRRVDARLRPNQVIALALPFALDEPGGLVDREQARSILRVCARELWTSHGLRSLAPEDPAYLGHYAGGPEARDAAYHQGTVWAWLLGPFARAHWRVHGDAAAARAWLDAMVPHLADAGLGTVSEIFDGDPPHLPRGCFAQAWSVAQLLEAWWAIGDAQPSGEAVASGGATSSAGAASSGGSASSAGPSA